MATDIEKLKKEIEELERQIEAHPFGGLLDRNRQEQLYRKLKKKRKELAVLEKPPEPKPARAKTPRKKKPAKK
jgi:hypothetical protein